MQDNKARAQRRYELGMRVCVGARPWAPPLTGGLLGLSCYLLLGTLTSSAFWSPDATDTADRILSIAVVVALVALIVGAIVYWAVARRCHVRWHTELTDDGRAGVVDRYAELIEGLAADGPRVKSLRISKSDLEPLSATHRQMLERLIDTAAAVSQAGFCETIQRDAHTLLAAAKRHRELSLDSIASEQTAVPVRLVELDGVITKSAADLLAALEAGDCRCRWGWK